MQTPRNNSKNINIIDCDLHHEVSKPKELYPYLPADYVEYIEDFGTMMPAVGYTNLPHKGRRAELWEGTDKDPQTNIELAREKHLDLYGIDIAVLTGSTVYGAAVHPNSDYGAAMCRAFNDWTLGSVDISILRMRETQLLSGSGLKTETAFPNCSKACRD